MSAASDSIDKWKREGERYFDTKSSFEKCFFFSSGEKDEGAWVDFILFGKALQNTRREKEKRRCSVRSSSEEKKREGEEGGEEYIDSEEFEAICSLEDARGNGEGDEEGEGEGVT